MAKFYFVVYSLILLVLFSCSTSTLQYENAKEVFKNVDVEKVIGMAKEVSPIENSVNPIVVTPYFKETMPISYSEIFDSTYIVPLETSEESLLGNISSMQILNDTIYILDKRNTKSLKCFNSDGQFIGNFGATGSAPNEYLEPTDFSVYKDYVEIFDQFQHRLIKYNKRNRNYISTHNIPFRATQYKRMDDTTLVFRGSMCQNYHIDKLLDYSLWITDSCFNIRNVAFKYPSSKYTIYESSKNLQQVTDGIVSFHNCSDSILYFNALGEYKVIASVDYKSTNAHDRSLLLAENKEKFGEAMQKGSYIMHDNYYSYNDYSLFTFITWQKDNYILIKGDRTYSFNKVENDYVNCLLPFTYVMFATQDYIITSIDAFLFEDIITHKSEILSSLEKMYGKENVLSVIEKCEGISAEDNPVLVFHRLKK